jgi:hypothetical protein
MAKQSLDSYARRNRMRTWRRGPFVAAALPLALGTGLISTNRAAGIAWALLVCGAGLLSVALTQPPVALTQPPVAPDRRRRGGRDRVTR